MTWNVFPCRCMCLCLNKCHACSCQHACTLCICKCVSAFGSVCCVSTLHVWVHIYNIMSAQCHVLHVHAFVHKTANISTYMCMCMSMHNIMFYNTFRSMHPFTYMHVSLQVRPKSIAAGWSGVWLGVVRFQLMVPTAVTRTTMHWALLRTIWRVLLILG